MVRAESARVSTRMAKERAAKARARKSAALAKDKQERSVK